MAVHLKYGTGDSLLYGPNGHMVYDCGTACNACDPALPATLCVVLSGLAGDFAAYNGLHELPWVTGCHWVVEYGDAWVSLTFTGGHWEGSVGADTDCSIHFAAADGDDCAPWDAAFAYSSCTVTACTDADSCTDSASAVFQAVECPDNTCNACDPAIPDTLYATWSSLAGDWAAANGKTALTWVSTCVWQAVVGSVTVSVWYYGGTWGADVSTGGFCTLRRDGPNTACAPEGTYSSEIDCSDVACTDHDSCEDSSGATCVVSYT